MPIETIEKSEQQGLAWTRMWLDVTEIEPAAPRDTPRDVSQTRDELARQVEWFHLGEQGKHIQSILREAGEVDALYAWEAYLEEHLDFPFLARVAEYQEGGPLQSGNRLKVLDINMVDDLYGIIVDVRLGRSRYAFPLCDLDVVDQHTANHQIVEDYCTWFANR